MVRAGIGQCCVLCGRHLGGQNCDNENGIITCKNQDCIGEYEKTLKKKIRAKGRKK